MLGTKLLAAETNKVEKCRDGVVASGLLVFTDCVLFNTWIVVQVQRCAFSPPYDRVHLHGGNGNGDQRLVHTM
jgi:hypothetical protein